MITLWNKTIQTLLASSDRSSIILGVHLVSNPLHVCHLWYSGETTCLECGLPYMDMDYDEDMSISEILNNMPVSKKAFEVASKGTNRVNKEYIKELYAKHLEQINTVAGSK